MIQSKLNSFKSLIKIFTFFFLPLVFSPSGLSLDIGLNFQCLGPAQAPSLPWSKYEYSRGAVVSADNMSAVVIGRVAVNPLASGPAKQIKII